MTTITRLSTISTLTNKLFDEAPPSGRLVGVCTACREVLRSTGLLDVELDDLMKLVEDGCAGAIPADVRQRLEHRRDAEDSDYLDLSNDETGKHSDTDALLDFSRARALSVVIFLLDGSDEAMRESLYEALIALPDAEAARLRERVNELLPGQ